MYFHTIKMHLTALVEGFFKGYFELYNLFCFGCFNSANIFLNTNQVAS